MTRDEFKAMIREPTTAMYRMMLMRFPESKPDDGYWEKVIAEFSEYAGRYKGTDIREYVASYAAFCLRTLQWAATGKEQGPREVECRSLTKGEIIDTLKASDWELVEFLWNSKRTILRKEEG